MLTAVSVTNPRGDTLQLPLMSSGGFAVREIDGLDPVSATLSTSSMAQQDGAQAQNARRDVRNIVIKIGLEADWISQTPESLRAILYDYLMTKADVVMGFYRDGNLFATSAGQVEDFAAPLFTDDPEADISVVCYDPDFYAALPVQTDGLSRIDSVPLVITYDGSSDAGIIFTLSIDRPLTEITLYNRTPANRIQKMTIAGTYVANDQVIVNTIQGSKAITLVRAGLPISQLTGYDLTSTWISLQKGDNEFRVVTDTAGVPYTMVYTAKYGGL